jgi:predicted nucleic acid-binding protein
VPVVDASVYVALLREDEAGHAACRVWLDRATERGDALVAPAVLAPEVVGAISRGLADRPLAQRVAGQLLSGAIVTLEPIGPALTKRAAAVAAEHRIRGCDAIYVALAAELDDVLVTLDRQQAQRGGSAVTVIDPTDAVLNAD